MVNENNKKEYVYKFVPHQKVKEYKRMGWVVVSTFNNSPQHAKYAVIMEKLK
jgi:secreted PhoX family phosphatase